VPAPHADQPTCSLSRLDRRHFLGVTGGAALALLAACGSDDSGSSSTAAASTSPAETADPTAPEAEGWTFTDDRGVTVTLPKPPERIVAYVGTAAVLWDFGVRPIGVFGPTRNDDGTPQAAAGSVDLDAVLSAGGENWDGVNLEALAAMKPDLVVSGGVESPWVIGEQLDEIAKIAPVAIIEVYQAPASEILGNYARFAEATGIDLDSDELVAARAAYEDAATALHAAAAANPGLSVLITYADTDGLYIAKPADFPDLLEFQRLGIGVIEPEGSDSFWVRLSWEVADTYPADLILHDVRSFSLQPDVLAKDQPTWAALPAVEAGQVGTWSAEAILSYQGLTTVFDDLRTTIETSSADVV
jgi:iron complex transport system substrate-binding protein